jgi:hypothetical protein
VPTLLTGGEKDVQAPIPELDIIPSSGDVPKKDAPVLKSVHELAARYPCHGDRSDLVFAAVRRSRA